MYGYDDLKKTISIKDDQVECPVLDCLHIVARQRKLFKREAKFKCPDHNIYISPSTFEYENESDNLLWDHCLFENHKRNKRESRVARDNSEDAVTWNVFRFLENNNLLDAFLSDLSGLDIDYHEAIFWSCQGLEARPWKPLNTARATFGETISRGSEPDLILDTDSTLFFIEAKLTASNETVPSNPSKLKKYTTGAKEWFSKVFNSDFQTIAVKEKKYELMRFWLLGSWLANWMRRRFMLINLVCEENDKAIEGEFGQYLLQDEKKRFIRCSWDDIYRFVSASPLESPDKDEFMDYFNNKTIGYKDGVLQKAFMGSQRKFFGTPEEIKYIAPEDVP